MSFYVDRVLPYLINLACSLEPARKQREAIVPLAEGEVLEIGFGGGLNLPFYDERKVRKVWALEPSAGMRKQARPRVAATNLEVELIDLPAETIPLEASSVDTVLMTYTLCTIPDAVAALDEMRRVLKPGGSLLFCEHGLAPEPGVSRWQRRMNPAWQRIAGGCNMDRDIPDLIEKGGFRIAADHRGYIPGVRMFCYNYRGLAKAA